jgi:hypothetical protein
MAKREKKWKAKRNTDGAVVVDRNDNRVCWVGECGINEGGFFTAKQCHALASRIARLLNEDDARKASKKKAKVKK